MAEIIVRHVGSVIGSDSDLGKRLSLNAIRSLPAFQELDDTTTAVLVKIMTPEFMIQGLDSIEGFFRQIPTPEDHNECKNYTKLARLYRMPAEVLAARSRLRHDIFQSSDPDASRIVEIVVKSINKMRTTGMVEAKPWENEAFADMEAGLAQLALCHKPEETGNSHKHKFLTYLRWVVQGRKESDTPFAAQTNSEDTTVRSRAHGSLDKLSDGCISGNCANCGSHNAAHQCKLCLITSNDHESEHIVSATTYCNESCQNAHFEAHKSACKEARKLARSAALLMDAFYQYLRAADSLTACSGITCEQGIIVKHFTAMSKTATSSLRHLAGSQSVADAAMTGLKCGDVHLWARPILELLIRPCCATVEIVNHIVKNAETAVAHDLRSGSLRHITYNTLRPHSVARLTLPSGSRYVLDPSAAQFGWEESLAPWDEYARRRIHQIDDIAILQPHGEAQGRIIDPKEVAPEFQGYTSAKEHVAAELVKILRARKGGIRALLKLSDGQFEKAKRDLVSTMEEFLLGFAKEFK
ncbi:hypothetical protein Daus18300_002621 [Diaporthe australafricana]|uniref:Suppressor of anucleate metulae protein B n=1 Tax=Diaporthe australafricana TaxID=127596 RepID=A0ABR3XN66_9PEZI